MPTTAFKVSSAVLIYSLCLLVANKALAQVTDGIAALVNNDVITFSDVRREIGDAEKAIAQSSLPPEEKSKRIRELRLAAINGLIDRRLIIQEFDRKQFQMPQNLVDAQIRSIIREKHGGDRAKFNAALRKEGKTMEQLRKEVEDELKLQAMVFQFIQKRVVVSPEKVERYYRENKKEFAPPAEARLAILFLSRSASPEKRTDERGRTIEVDPQKVLADDLLRKIRAGGDFAELTRIYSEGPHREEGGDWGWLTQEALRPDLAEVAFSLSKGSVSKVIETEEGYYIIKALDVKNPGPPPLEKIRDEVEKRIQIIEGRDIQNELIQRLRKENFVKIF